MWRFAARRTAMLVAALLVSSFVIFVSLDLAPGDPLATLSGGRTLPPEALDQLRAQHHLDDPFLSRYAHWLGDVVLHGDLGTSIAFREPVSSVIGARAGVTVALVAYAALLIVVVGVGLGIVAGLRRGAVDVSVIVLTTVSPRCRRSWGRSCCSACSRSTSAGSPPWGPGRGSATRSIT